MRARARSGTGRSHPRASVRRTGGACARCPWLLGSCPTPNCPASLLPELSSPSLPPWQVGGKQTLCACFVCWLPMTDVGLGHSHPLHSVLDTSTLLCASGVSCARAADWAPHCVLVLGYDLTAACALYAVSCRQSARDEAAAASAAAEGGMFGRPGSSVSDIHHSSNVTTRCSSTRRHMEGAGPRTRSMATE